jgi:hypothetical protein
MNDNKRLYAVCSHIGALAALNQGFAKAGIEVSLKAEEMRTANELLEAAAAKLNNQIDGFKFSSFPNLDIRKPYTDIGGKRYAPGLRRGKNYTPPKKRRK